ncbi:MAG: hypothetical protein HOV81_15720 [Kofleriaceae bacterium]|nr:hypothetical protein [Kofleriaceae bacterium]
MSDVGRSIKEGTGYGLIAGTVLGLGLVLATVIDGGPPIIVFRSLASVLLGPAAFAQTPAATAVVLGVITLQYFSAMFGLFYGVYNSALTLRTRRSLPREAAIGMIYGAMVWLVSFRLVVPLRWPWLLVVPAVPVFAMLVLLYGLPLGLLYATAERHAVSRTRDIRSCC